MKIHLPLWSHQQQISDYAASHSGTLLLAGCGTGKTLAALATADQIGARRILILTVRAAVASVWEDDLCAHTDMDIMDMRFLDNRYGTIAERRAGLEKHGRQRDLLVVTNYEAARLLGLGDFVWDLVIADESHRLKSHNSKQSIDLAHELRGVPYKLAMTGTAWDDRPTDVFGQERWLAPGTKRSGSLTSARFGSWTNFFEKYVNYRQQDNIKIPESYKNLDQLAEVIADHFLFIDRDKVLDLPPVTKIIRPVWLSAKHYRAYEKLEEELTTELLGPDITVDNQMVLKLRLHQITGGYYQPDDEDAIRNIPEGDAKLDALEAIAEEAGTEPVVIFTRFTEDVKRIGFLLDRMKISHLELTGRRDQHQAWKSGGAQVLIANIQAGGVGINLTRSSIVVFYSTGYSRTDYVQAMYRVDRPPQQHKVREYHIIAQGTVDQEIHDMITDKGKTSNRLLSALDQPRRSLSTRIERNG